VCRPRRTITTIITGNPQLWLRVGDTVHVEGSATVVPTTTGLTQIYVPVPIDSNINGTPTSASWSTTPSPPAPTTCTTR
jgi:hypothetical protein